MSKNLKLSFAKDVLRLSSNINVLDVRTLKDKKIFVEMTGVEEAESNKGNKYVKLISLVDGKETVFFSNLLSAIIVTPTEFAAIKERGPVMDNGISAYELLDEERKQRLHEIICEEKDDEEGNTKIEVDLTKLNNNSFEIVGISTFFRQDDAGVHLEPHPATPLRNYANYAAALNAAKAQDPEATFITYDMLRDFCGTELPQVSKRVKMDDPNNWSYQFIIISQSEEDEK